MTDASMQIGRLAMREESGAGARPMHIDWARSLRDQCAAAGVPFFFKQWGEFLPGDVLDDAVGLIRYPDGSEFVNVTDGDDIVLEFAETHRGAPKQIWRHWWASGDGRLVKRCGKKRAGAELDGREHREFPRASEMAPT